MEFVPSRGYRYAFKRGMRGTDVAALQINLGVVVDGIFGANTEAAVKKLQVAGKLTVDGIAGLVTQQRIVLSRSKLASDRHSLPAGLLRSIAANESAFALAAYSSHPSDSGYDLGAYQRSSGQDPKPSQAFIKDAYDVLTASELTAANLAASFKSFRGGAAVTSDRRAWELAVLSHNWPAAAQNLATIGRIYTSQPDDVPESWIEQASGGRLKTAQEWVASYIERATVYVAW